MYEGPHATSNPKVGLRGSKAYSKWDAFGFVGCHDGGTT